MIFLLIVFIGLWLIGLSIPWYIWVICVGLWLLEGK